MNPMELEFASLEERDRQYNARASVADFDACVREYAERSEQARRQCVGIHDLRYGMGAAERLDLQGAAAQVLVVDVVAAEHAVRLADRYDLYRLRIIHRSHQCLLRH